MSEPKYLKCACRHCQGTIEFPAHGLGRAIPCPHCGQKTSLLASPSAAAGQSPHSSEDKPMPEAGPTDGDDIDTSSEHDTDTEQRTSAPRARIDGLLRFGLVLILALGLGAVAVAFRPWQLKRRAASETGSAPPSEKSSNTTVAAPAPNPPPSPAAAAPKSLSDLQAGAVRLEKAAGSSLVYAVGTLRNDSAHQRFGVRIELALSARDGANTGTAKDYRAVLEPHQEWHFRALVLDTKAASARVASISEDE